MVQVPNLGFVVDPSARGKADDLAVVSHGLNVDPLTGLDGLQAADREALAAAQAEQRRVLTGHVLHRQNAHADQVGAVDALEALGDHGAYAQKQRSLGGPVARRAGAVLLAREHDERHALRPVLLSRVEDRDLGAIGEVPRPVTLARGKSVAKADVAERPPLHHLVVAPSRAEAVEVESVDAVLDEVVPGRAVRRDRASR